MANQKECKFFLVSRTEVN